MMILGLPVGEERAWQSRLRSGAPLRKASGQILIDTIYKAQDQSFQQLLASSHKQAH